MTTIVSASDLATVSAGTSLPLVPDAAIHYRCGDNFVGHYGFLPFRAFLATIPKVVFFLVLFESFESFVVF
jgi:hypothetical protein